MPILIIIILTLLDQITKHFFVNVINYGAAFGILQGYTWLFILVSFIVIFVCVKYYKVKELRLSLTFILAGTIGNLIDRVFFGYVRDFIDFKIWPVFNLADTYNIIGLILLAYILFKKK
ncbi:signal peptidase II [archaeon]|nr:signal peptidase II [archaeon]